MKKLMIVLIVLMLSNSSLAVEAKDSSLPDKAKEKFKEARKEQHYRHVLQKNEVEHQGEMRVTRSKYDQKVRRRRRVYYGNRRRGYVGGRGYLSRRVYNRTPRRYASFSSSSGYRRVFNY